MNIYDKEEITKVQTDKYNFHITSVASRNLLK